MIAACEGPTGSLIGCPARDSPTTASVTGASSRAPTRSSLRTAKPSIAELSNGGTAASLRSSRDSTRPSASSSGTDSSPSGSAHSSTSSRARSISSSVVEDT